MDYKVERGEDKMNKEEVKKILDYLQDKVQECYKEETEIAIQRFLEEWSE